MAIRSSRRTPRVSTSLSIKAPANPALQGSIRIVSVVRFRRWLVDGDIQELLGNSVVGRVTVLLDVFLVFSGSKERSGSAHSLVRQLCLVLGSLEHRWGMIRGQDPRLWDREG